MSGQYETTITANKMFTGKTSEYGMSVFSDPYAQEMFQKFEEEYKKKYTVKQAYDNQEFLRKMRTDMKREYLTRKKQIKLLQQNAAVEFRNAEFTLQEHYATQASKYHFGVSAVDICAPLVSQIQLPTGETLDLKTFNMHHEFAKLKQMHENLRCEQEQMAADYKLRQQEQQEEEARRTSWWRQSPSTDNDNDRELLACWDSSCTLCGGGRDVATTRRSAFGGCYDDDYNYEYQEEQPHTQPQQQEPEDEQEQWNTDNEWGLPLTAEEIEILECGAAAELQMLTDTNYWVRLSCHTAAERARSLRSELSLRAMSDEDLEVYLRECEALKYDTEDEEEIIRQYEIANASYQQHLIDEENAAMVIPDVAPISDEPASAGGVTLASAKAKKSSSSHKKSAASATKARIAKQQQQQHQQGKKKFVPIQVTINDNRSSHAHDQETTAILSASRIEINLPKKQLQNATRDAKKRYYKKWNSINAAQKQSNARGTRIENLPKSMEYMSDCECY